MRHVDLPRAFPDAGRRDDEAALQHGAAVDEGRGVAGDEDEDLGGVAEAVIADGEPGDDVVRNVVEEDQPERQPAEQIEPQIAPGSGRRDRCPLEGGDRGDCGLDAMGARGLDAR